MNTKTFEDWRERWVMVERKARDNLAKGSEYDIETARQCDRDESRLMYDLLAYLATFDPAGDGIRTNDPRLTERLHGIICLAQLVAPNAAPDKK